MIDYKGILLRVVDNIEDKNDALVPCPRDFGIIHWDGKCRAKCKDCWKDALAATEEALFLQEAAGEND